MCRMLGVVAAAREDHGPLLPRLATLSTAHPHGWGIATGGGAHAWQVHRSTLSAGDDPGFAEVAARAQGPILIAHLRRRTVGSVSLANTHPFRRGRWVFAHNGTMPGLAELHGRISPRRRAEIEGDTDSEHLFALLLTALDTVGASDGLAGAAVAAADAAVTAMIAEVTARGGAATFLCSDGEVLYAFRHGRTLHMLERPSARLVASEPLSDEPWQAMPEGVLVRISPPA